MSTSGNRDEQGLLQRAHREYSIPAPASHCSTPWSTLSASLADSSGSLLADALTSEGTSAAHRELKPGPAAGEGHESVTSRGGLTYM